MKSEMNPLKVVHLLSSLILMKLIMVQYSNPTSPTMNKTDQNFLNLISDQNFLDLSLSTTSASAPPPRRRNQTPAQGKCPLIEPPYPWATERRASVQSIQQLQAKGIDAVTGSVQCKRCNKRFEVEYDLAAKFREVAVFITKHLEEMRHRAPAAWMNPVLPDCGFCSQRNCAKPVASKKKKINWLFLFLGQMVGCCKLSELKYFCKHTKKHRTGAKDRVLYLTYLEICNQLDPHPTFC